MRSILNLSILEEREEEKKEEEEKERRMIVPQTNQFPSAKKKRGEVRRERRYNYSVLPDIKEKGKGKITD